MTTMLLFRNSTGWMMSEFIDGKPAPRLIELFGTHTLPLPFTAAASPERVQAEIAKLNPTAKVMLVLS